jgi:mRNA interferase MazF
MALRIYRGGLYYADLSPAKGSEQGGLRPVLAIQNDIGNKHAPTTIIVPLTSQIKKPLPTHCVITATDTSGLSEDSLALAEQIRTIDKSRIKTVIGRASDEEIAELDKALLISIGLVN